jgi:hypothetical protein
MVRALEFAAILAFDIRRRLQRFMGAPHVATGGGNLFLGNRHDTSLLARVGRLMRLRRISMKRKNLDHGSRAAHL